MTKIHPVVMLVNTFNWSTMAVRFRTNDVFPLVRQVESKFHAAKQGLPFSFTFMDNDFDKLYHAEQQTGQIFITFAVFAILIACLGLFGLVTYAAEQRTKEIGIRKVLAPASVVSSVCSARTSRSLSGSLRLSPSPPRGGPCTNG